MWLFQYLIWFVLFIPMVLCGYPNEVVGTIPLTIQPQAVVVLPTDRFLYALDNVTGALSVVDTLFFKETSKLSFSGVPKSIALSMDGKTLYVLTSQQDVLNLVDLEDPSTLPSPSTLSLQTSGVSFDQFVVGPGSSDKDLLILSSRTENTIYVFDRFTESLRFNGSIDHIDLPFEPVSLATTPDGLRIVVCASDGQLRTYLTSSLGQAGAGLNLGAFTSSANFLDVKTANIGAGAFGFVANSISLGELFLVNMVNTDFNLFVVDADPGTTTTTEPIFVGDAPSGSLITQVKRAKDDASASATYLFASNRTSGTISVLDTADIGSSAKMEPIDTISDVTDVPLHGMAASSEGYLYAANQSGSVLSVITDQPFLHIQSVSSDTVVNEDVTVSLHSNIGGTLSILRYTGESTTAVSTTLGTEIETATLEANTDTNVTFSTEKLEEGENTIAFFLKNGELLGRAAAIITKDAPPSTPTGFRLAFGNQKIFAKWKRLQQSDISHYLLFFGTETADGGVGTLTSPQRVDQPSSGNLSFTLEPVENGTTVFANVVALDNSGNMSGATETLSETAEATIGILGRVNETGGCASDRPGYPGHLLFLATFMILFRFRNFKGAVAKCPSTLFSLAHHPHVLFKVRSGGSLAAASYLGYFATAPKNRILRQCLKRSQQIALIFGIVFFSKAIHAQTVSKNDLSSPQRASTEFRVGWWVPKDKVLKDALGKLGNELLELRFGLVVKSWDFGVEGGFLRETSRLVGVSSGRQSGEKSHLTLVPTEFSAQYNVWLGEDPIVVPFARVGYDLIYFSVSEPQNSVSGLKHAFSAQGGIRIMLEQFAMSNDPEDLLGISHFYLEGIVSYRHQFSDGLDFGGWIFQPGFGIEF